MLENSHQRRSRCWCVLTYWKYAPRAPTAAALLDDLFAHSSGANFNELLWRKYALYLENIESVL